MHLVRAGQRDVVRRRVPEQLGEAEVGDLHAAPLVEQDVLGLDVAMDDAFVVGVLQRVADLRHDRQRLGRRQAARLDELPQVGAVDVLHHEVVKSARPLPKS